VKVESIRLPAIACALALPLCALAIRPVVEMGVNDDWSYIKTVQILAQTGHIVYNGWATAMLGWQLYLGALFVKLFGFSFTIVRASVLLIAMATAFLTQRTMVRAGISEWNAALGTLVIVTSPLFLPLAFSFMTDVSCLFCIVLCLYACLRALQAETDRAALAWLCFAAISNAIGGTVRQIAWLGVLVMVPSTIWLLRRRPRFLLMGSLLYVGCVAFVFASVHWFHQQPYSVPENLIRGRVNLKTFLFLASNMFRAGLDTSLFLLPILLLFVPELRRGNRRSTMFFIAGSIVFVAFCLVAVGHHGLPPWLAPYMGNYVTSYGLLEDGVRLLVTILNAASVLALFALILADTKKLPSAAGLVQKISWHRLTVLIVPFTVAYIILLMPRAAFKGFLFFDRYLIPIITMLLILILRFYQEWVQSRIPTVALLWIAVFAAFGIAGTHDLFTLLRARLAAIDELRLAGVPPTAIDAGFEYNGWIQIERAGFVNDPQIRILPGDHFSPVFLDSFSVLSPRYGMAYSPGECLGQAGFAPVAVHTWLGPRSNNTIYIVNVGNSTNH
jgi:Dolichyl-phosphate-mannose-protein mannosyltransferase